MIRSALPWMAGWGAVALLTAVTSCTPQIRDFDSAGSGGSSASGGGDATSSGPGGGDAASSGPGGGDAAVCRPGESESCYAGPEGTLNRGICRAGIKTCNRGGTGYGPCEGEVLPRPERCDTSDDEDCDGATGEECVYPRCADAPPGSTSGVYQLDPDSGGPAPSFAVYCDLVADGGGWALVHNSVGSEGGATLPFWNIPFDGRLRPKGLPVLSENFYAGPLYLHGREYRDEIEDLEGNARVVLRAAADGIDESSMKLLRPNHTGGDADIFFSHFNAGWSSPDFDGDSESGANCARSNLNVTQHYFLCQAPYNLGADDDDPRDDGGWGPHVATYIADRLDLANDGSEYTRVRRISRWTRW